MVVIVVFSSWLFKISFMDKIYQGFEGLEVYKSARIFRKKISELVKTFPKSEEYFLKSQITRSSRSIAANIAEGYGRFHHQEFIQFCRQARGSLNETLEHLTCAFDENYSSEEQLNDFRNDVQNLLRLVNGFINYLQKQQILTKSSKSKESLTANTNTTNTTNSTNTTL